MKKDNVTKNEWTVIFQPSGKRGTAEDGRTIMEAALSLGVEIAGGCGMRATCGKCRVRISEGAFDKYGIASGSGNLSPISDSERAFISPDDEAQGYRLACQTMIHGDVVVFVPEASRPGSQLVRKAVQDVKIDLNPAVKTYFVELPEATLEDSLNDWDRLQRGLREGYGLDGLTIDFPVLTELSSTLRQGGWTVTVSVWNDREVIRVVAGQSGQNYGLAVDIGTTTVAGYLCSLRDGSLVAMVSMMNPQVSYGEDVMSRISYAMTESGGLNELRRVIIEGINALIDEACTKAGIAGRDIVDMTVVGNTCMHHILLGIDPQFIGKAPFVPAIRGSLDIKARDVKLNLSPGAYVHSLPVEAGFVGSDNVAVVLAEKPYDQEKIELIIDIGTNGELVLGNRQRLLSCSCATGPALEGAEIRHGIRAVPGAIERIAIDKQTKEVRYDVIEGLPGATGICGSAIIDILPEMLNAGIIDKTGRFSEEVDSPRFRMVDGMPEFVIAWEPETSVGHDIVICQKDVRAIQLAKAAMYAGARILMRQMGIEKIDKVKLAGAFGNYIDKHSALRLGLLPDCDPADIELIGNAAGAGARAALLDVAQRREADKISRTVEYLDLNQYPEFERMFAQAMWIPHMKESFPHLTAEES